MKYFQCNAHEFDYVTDLNVVQKYKDLQKLREEHKALIARKPVDTRYDDALNCVLDAVSIHNTEDELKTTLEALIRNRKPALRKLKREDSLLCVLQLIIGFSEFDEQGFRAFVQMCSPAEGSLEEWEKEKAALELEIQTIQEDIVDCLDFGFFDRDYEPTEAYLDGAEREAGRFVEAWKKRSAWFTEPVSVYGRSIRSITSPEVQKRWREAYTALGVSPAKTPVFMASKEPKPVGALA